MSTMKKTNKTNGETNFVKVSVSLTKDMEQHIHKRVLTDPEQNFSRYVRRLVKRDMRRKEEVA